MKIIGTTELVDFPEIGLHGVKAKVDTGAQTSAIDVRQLKLVERDGRKVLSCKLIHPKNPVVEFTNYTIRTVKSSNGISEDRYVVKLVIQLFNKKYKAEFTLANRKSMTYPVLLGKRLLSGKFLVDVSKKNLSASTKSN